jgi:RNA polymerase sigma-70 factor (ECF subfamily)
VASRFGTEPTDDTAFAELYRQHYAPVLAYVLRRTRRSTADDVVAETFLIAWRRRSDLVGDPLPWLLGVARRVYANQLRAARRAEALTERVSIEVRSDHRDTVDEIVLVDVALQSALRSLGESDREALLLTAWDGLSPAQAARVLGCLGSTFRVRLHRAKRRLRRALDEAEAGESQPEAAHVVPSGSKG